MHTNPDLGFMCAEFGARDDLDIVLVCEIFGYIKNYPISLCIYAKNYYKFL